MGISVLNPPEKYLSGPWGRERGEARRREEKRRKNETGKKTGPIRTHENVRIHDCIIFFFYLFTDTHTRILCVYAVPIVLALISFKIIYVYINQFARDTRSIFPFVSIPVTFLCKTVKKKKTE